MKKIMTLFARVFRNPVWLSMLVSVLVTNDMHGFALAGKLEDWMQQSNGFPRKWAVRGPADINQEYRWNVPVITYGFDKSFKDYFDDAATNAIAEAVEIINDLPAASELNLQDFASYTLTHNFATNNPYDLKSFALSSLLNQLGLDNPFQAMYLITHWDAELWTYAIFVSSVIERFPEEELDWLEKRNYDPESLKPSTSINDCLFVGEILSSQDMMLTQPYTVDPTGFSSTVAAMNLDYGAIYEGLTKDDVGGLRYLYNPTNINFETLLPGVRSSDPEGAPLINGAWRPGVNKITLVPHPTDPATGEWLSWTNTYLDVILENGSLRTQQVARVATSPDVLFKVSELLSTGTDRWKSHAIENNRPAGRGPGIIVPAAEINIEPFACEFFSGASSSQVYTCQWASLQPGSGPVIPLRRNPASTTELAVEFELTGRTPASTIRWVVPALVGKEVQLQVSTNLVDWSTLQHFTYGGDRLRWIHTGTENKQFFRVISAP